MGSTSYLCTVYLRVHSERGDSFGLVSCCGDVSYLLMRITSFGRPGWLLSGQVSKEVGCKRQIVVASKAIVRIQETCRELDASQSSGITAGFSFYSRGWLQPSNIVHITMRKIASLHRTSQGEEFRFRSKCFQA